MLDWRTVKSVKGQTRGRICVAVGRTTRVIFGLYTSFPLEYGLHRNQQLESGQGRTRRGRLRGGKRTGRIDAKNPVPGALSVRTSHFSENYPNHSHHSDFFPILLTYVFFAPTGILLHTRLLSFPLVLFVGRHSQNTVYRMLPHSSQFSSTIHSVQ